MDLCIMKNCVHRWFHRWLFETPENREVKLKSGHLATLVTEFQLILAVDKKKKKMIQRDNIFHWEVCQIIHLGQCWPHF